ncbi:phosphatase PAP2 family protein [Pontibacter silvestris]|uniref:Phosphatase PAP2 family protein n=1 Tax=Pontibacter silvestris TaxID=2305183 RepID=A0ABW4WV87_9BACT|nr:phosphatase PAP2 family protein [Pontibacter silvestris]MCC9136503.1 phosphatase PAP2 family protein [Pontibacter silvestris]
MKLMLYVLFMFSLTLPAWAQQKDDSGPVLSANDSSSLADEIKQNLHPLVRKAIVPSILIGWGATHMDDEGLFEGSEGLRSAVQRNYSNFYTTIDDHTTFAPVLMAVGLKLAGVKGEHHFTEQAVLLGMTYFLNRSITNNLKSITKVNRPDGLSNDAFPSAHTSTAFAYATFFHKEYGRQSIWYSIAGYSFATATGVMRILNDRHWLSDVLAGAGIGILSAEVAYLIYPLLQRKIVNSFKEKEKLSIAPFYSQGAGGIAVLYRIH